MKNQVQLICYIDRFSGGNIKSLQQLLTGPLKDVFGGVHLLPFFFPIDGADAGFDPIDHTQVDPQLGNWSDIRELSEHIDVMGDVIVNHMSAQSPQFIDFLKHGDDSDFADLFLTFDKVFKNGATEKELLHIYRPRPGFPFTTKSLGNGSKKMLWTTFTTNQIDIDVNGAKGKEYLLSILKQFHDAGIKMIRLDAAGYAIKKPGTSCFMIPETFDFIQWFRDKAADFGMEVLVEIHSYFKQQVEIAKKVDRVYDFALPPLVLHAIYTGNATHLKHWLEISPRNAITVLDTHDGIGVIDVGSSNGEPGLLPDSEIEAIVEMIHKNSQGQSKQATGEAASNLDLYQVNCTYYDALGGDDDRYLLARAIQFFAPGVPQVYYTGLLAEPNDMDLLAKTLVGRDINRHYFTEEELPQALERTVVKQLIDLIRFRNTHPAFNGDFHIDESTDQMLNLRWQNGASKAVLKANLELSSYEIEVN
ncbi:MAG: sucrose phosphorylase [Bacteroidetes bacterium]|nr:MAG: sucrose phosphorylase [Bacteroidota bacterium]